MLRRLDLRAEPGAPARSMLPRAAVDVAAAIDAVRPVIEDVARRGYPAAREASLRFDGADVAAPRVTPGELASALTRLDPQVRAALEESIRRARIAHEAQRRETVTTTVVAGGTVTETWIPVQRVGLYVPGGLNVLPSSVVMNVVPAQIAGVRSLVVASPPQREHAGRVHPTILAACALLGVDEVYAVGGAQAVALLAHGDTGLGLSPVDMITGPGNVYVVAAKRLLRGVVGVDSEAGPTEIAILADYSADPAHVAADLISQAEHDPLAASVLVTPSRALANAVDAELACQVPATKHAERITAALTGSQSASLIVRDIDQGIEVVNAYAAEHLEVITMYPRSVAERVRNAGCVFVGAHSPVSLGDYCAGSNHVLPTGGTARHGSGLSVQTFLKGVHLVEYSAAALAEAAPHVVALAEAEDLPAHANAITIRVGDE
jgi:histidinol dehydrogenase